MHDLCPAKRRKTAVVKQHTTHENDAVAMMRFAVANPHLVEVEREFFARRNAQCKNKRGSEQSRKRTK